MDKDYFISNGIPPLEQTMQWHNSGDCLFNPNWNHQFNPFDSIVSSPAAADFIGNLPQPSFNNLPTPYITNNSTTTPVNSQPKLLVPNLASSLLLNPPPLPPALSTDPGFAQRAAKFSCFGSRSFNGRSVDLSPGSAQPLGNGKLPRVSSSPSLKQGGSPLQINQTRMEIMPTNGLALGSDNNLGQIGRPVSNSNDPVSEPSGETGPKTPIRKRKAVSRGKTKDDLPAQVANGNMGGEADDGARAKRCKTVVERNGTENGNVNMEGNEGDENQKEAKDQNQKPPEPPKDYIHVRARRGQATDSHSLAERVRREKISERMKLLQDLVPGCNKVTGKALMLDEIINYVQSLQRQVEFLSMKLASVNPSLDFPAENLLTKDVCQPNGSVFPVNNQTSSLPCFQQLHNNNIPNGVLSKSAAVDTSMQLPPLDGFNEYLNQFPTMCEDDLQSFVQMGFSQGLSVTNPTSHMKIEM